ncbi:MAG TPA: histone deacetylase [Candidatus Thermoplasmatota archaeon]|nr:histone deacetylase [Candidatus Thermoplasmatota archaeon]
MITQVVFSDEFNKHDTADHPENADRLYVMLDAVEQSPLYKKVSFVKPMMLSEALLYEVHSAEMIQRIKDASEEGNTWIDLDTYVSKGDYETARLAAGGVLQASLDVMEQKATNAFCLVRPPGHHASAKRSMGFCLFNNAGIAAHTITKKNKRVLIFDHDVHHGNGTQEIFYARKDVMYQSFHLSPHYPGTGAPSEIGEGEGIGYTVNAPLGFGTGDGAVSQLLEEVFLPIARQFEPHLILVSAGFDSHHADQLGGLSLSVNFFGEMIKRLQEVQPRMVVTLEGGYNLQWLGKCFLSQLGQLVGTPQPFEDAVQGAGDVSSLVKKMKQELKEYWDV